MSPLQPPKPSILKAQKPVDMSDSTIRPSALRTSMPNAPLNWEYRSSLGGPMYVS